MRLFQGLEKKLRALRSRLAPLFYNGSAVWCPVCGKTARKFRAAGSGVRRREAAMCPFCRARERDRLVMLFFRRHPELFARQPMDLLHVAPEPELEKFLRARAGTGYLSVDIYHKDVMERMDIMTIGRPDASFDAVHCSHVLQDVPDDALALREIFRVLRPGGWAVLNVPIFSSGATKVIEATNRGHDRPLEQLRHYGHDYRELLERTGFSVEAFAPGDVRDASDPGDPALDHPMAGFVHFVRKPA